MSSRAKGDFTPDEAFAAGFVLNKLYTMKCFGRQGNKKHNRHTELANMPKSFPGDRGMVISVCRRMNNVLILIFKSSGEDHICALHEVEAMKMGLGLCNDYRAKVELRPLDEYLKEAKPSPQEEKPAAYVPLTDKEKRSRDFYEKNIKKWIDQNGLS